jgi:PAS domain S-box-containing protein
MGHASEETTRELADADVARGRLAAIVESTDDAVMSLSGDGTITSLNPGAERLYGYQAAEIVGQPIFALIPTVRQDVAHACLARVWEGEHLAHLEAVGRRKDGREMALSLGLAPIRDAAGQVIGIASIARDVTMWKEAEAKARQLVHEQAARAAAEAALRERDMFLSVAAHELKTPITSLRGYAQLLLRQLDRGGEIDAERLRRALVVIDQQSDRLARLVGQLLDVSRLEAGKLPPDGGTRFVVRLPAGDPVSGQPPDPVAGGQGEGG